MSEIRTHELLGDLPAPGTTTLLEASAGTGKTFTVAALVTRYVAEGVARLDDLLVITFGRAASQELRERVRAQLVDAERALRGPALGVDAPAAEHTVLIEHLLALPDPQVVHERLRAALASFDAATIATTHQFCQLVLRSLGVAGDTDPGVELVDDLDDLVVEVVDDLYLQRYARAETPPFSRSDALAIGRAAINDPQAALVPEGLPDDDRVGAKVAFAQACRRELDVRKLRLGILSYDDLLGRLAAALADDDAPARSRMRARWQVVLVDEFQDTDPVQWEVIDRAFVGHAAVVLIGDPKQSIYAFRGGDVVTYLTAREQATDEATLVQNWRSDADLVRSLAVVLTGAQLGDERIVVHPVDPALPDSRLEGAPQPAPFRVRVVTRSDLPLTNTGFVPVGVARELIARDCAADIARLLASDATWSGEPIAARHVAVLVHTRFSGRLVQEALRAAGIPAVISGGEHVVTTAGGDAWLTVLEAIEQPHRSGRVRAAALTPFFGESAQTLDAGGDALTDRVADTLRGWALLLRGAGVAAVAEAAEERGLGARVLATVGGERLLTDLRHVGHLLHEAAMADRLAVTGLLDWLRDQRRRDQPATERTRRLDSDAAAVQILTIHAAKGLQFPVVYLPFEFEARNNDSDRILLFHDEDGRRSLDVAGAGDGFADRRRRHRAEDAGETLRTCYVALTRAQSQVVAWWAPTLNTAAGGLHRLLLGREPGSGPVPVSAEVRDDDYVVRCLRLLQELGGPSPEPAVPAEPPVVDLGEAPEGLDVRRFTRPIDAEWRRTSYSGLIRVADDQPSGVTSEPETQPVLDEEAETQSPYAADPLGQALLADDALPLEPADPTPGVPSPMADLPAGATFGSLVHGVLEEADPDAPDLRAELLRHVEEQLGWWTVDVEPEALADALLPMLHTPLGPLAAQLTLARIPLRDRLCELDFEIPLTGGDRSATTRAEVRLRDVASLLRAHLTPDDPLLPYAERLTDPALGDQHLRGYLSGSIDVVLRVPAERAPGGHRYVVVDYKTNLLGDPDRPVTTADYDRAGLTDAMLHSHYPLQALLYAAVLHRFLRWRQPGYDPEQHLGGILYLFVRGMCGPDTPVVDGHPSGVFSWRPPAGLVLALSDLLDGRADP